MANLRIRIGGTWHEGGTWITGAPLQPQSERTSAASSAITAQQHLRMHSGPDWPAQIPQDLLQRSLTLSFFVTIECPTAAEMDAELARWLSADSPQPWQADTILRWTHLDYIGYTEFRAPWAALRCDSITHSGPQTLHIAFSVLAAELVHSAIYDQPRLLWPDGTAILWPDGLPILLNLDTTHHLVLSHPNLLWPTGQLVAWGDDTTITLASDQLNPAHN